MGLKGKSAIVMWAARGNGRGIALKLAEAGANVALVDLGNPSDPALQVITRRSAWLSFYACLA